jgi:hypothetical protein
MFEDRNRLIVRVVAVFVLAVGGFAVASPAAAEGVWVLQKTSQEVSGGAHSTNECLPSTSGSITDGSATFIEVYRARHCAGYDDGAGKVVSRCVWQPPPQRIAPQAKISLNATLSLSGDAADHMDHPFVNIDARVDVIPGDLFGLSGPYGAAPGSMTKTRPLALTSSEGGSFESVLQVTCASAGGSGTFQYHYAFQTDEMAASNAAAPTTEAGAESASSAPSSSEPQGDTGKSAITAAAAVLGGLLVSFGAAVAAGLAGIGQSDLSSTLSGLLKGQLPSDGFDEWKNKALAQGGDYVVRDNIAVVIPSAGNESAAPPAQQPSGEGIVTIGKEWGAALQGDLAKGERFVRSVKNILVGEMAAQSQGDIGSWKNVGADFIKDVGQDVSDIPGQLKSAAVAGGKTIASATSDAVKELKDPTNWTALGQATLQTGEDVVLSPVESVKKVGTFYEGVGASGVQAVEHMATHPLDTLKALAGVENWEKVMDPNVPVTERLGRYLFGVVDGASNVALVGDVLKGVKAISAATDTAKAVEAASDAAKTVEVATDADEAASAAERAWQDGRVIGQTKVDDFAKAKQEAEEAWKSGDEAGQAAANDKLRKSTLEIQGDKQALWEINRRDDQLKRDFNKEMGTVYRDTDDKVVSDICDQRGWDRNNLYEQPPGSGNWYNRETGRPDIVIVKPTNPKAGVSVGADRDVTVRVRETGDTWVADPNQPGQFIRAGEQGVLTDLPSNNLKQIYNKSFYEASGAAQHYPGMSEDQFAHKLDQVATDRLHAEAYGRGQKDLGVAIGKPGEDFSDAEQVSKAAQYKSEHLYQQAADLEDEGHHVEAQTTLAEGMRQSTKQFNRQVIGRAQAISAQGIDVKIPQRLADDMEVMKKTQTEGWSPAQVSTELAKRGTTIEDVTQRSAGLLEAMQKLKPR